MHTDKIEVAIGLPVYNTVEYPTFRSILALLSKAFNDGKFKVHVIDDWGRPVAMARNNIVDQFLKTKATHLLFLDADMVFDANVLERLYSADKDIIGEMYVRKSFPHLPTPGIKHVTEDNGVMFEVIYDWSGREPLFRVDVLGMGCTMIRREVFEKISFPWFEFVQTESGDKVEFIGEDYSFCLDAQDVGFGVWAIKGGEIGHVGTKMYTYDDFVAGSEPLIKARN